MDFMSYRTFLGTAGRYARYSYGTVLTVL